MATPFTHLLVAVTGLATVYGAVASPGIARADGKSAVAPVPAELVQWHSGLSVTSGSHSKPEWKSTLTAIDPEGPSALLVMHRSVGIRDVSEDGLNYSPDSFDAPKGARKSERNAAGKQGSSAQRAR